MELMMGGCWVGASGSSNSCSSSCSSSNSGRSSCSSRNSGGAEGVMSKNNRRDKATAVDQWVYEGCGYCSSALQVEVTNHAPQQVMQCSRIHIL